MAILRAANESLLSLRVEGLPDDELRVLRMHGEEGLSRLFEFDLELVSENPAIPFANVVGQPATLTFSTVGADRPVNGLVRRFEQGAIGRRFTRYHLRLVPGVWRLQQRVDCRIFQAKTTLEIVQEVLQAAGIPSSALRANLKASYAAREYCVQYQESDWAFICRLLEEEGIFYFFEHRPSQHILVLGDDPSAHGDIAGDATVVFREPSGFNPENEYVGTFRFAQAVHTGAAALRDYSFIRPNQSLETLDQGELDTDLEAFEYPGFYNAADQGSRLASVRRQEREAERRRAVGHSVCRRLVPGYRFTIANHARDDFNAAYLLTHLVHDAYEPQALEQEAPENESETEYRNEFRCIPSSVPFRPRRTTRRPAVRGPQSAVVVGPAGEEIYTDEYGRIKVQFHWDRVGTSDEKSSCWIRVATPWAGAQWGAIQIPRIGWEVMVAFLDGDLDRPVVIASLYNANQMPPYSLPDNKTQSGIKSASSPGSEGFNEIRFEDRKGEELFHVQAEKDRTTLTKNDDSQEVGHNRTRSVGNDESISIGANRTVSVAKNHSESVGGSESLSVDKGRSRSVTDSESVSIGKDQTISIDKNQNVTVGKDQAVMVDGNRNLTVSKKHAIQVEKDQEETIGGKSMTSVTKEYALQAKKIILQAEDQITFKTGDAQIVMKSNGDISVSGGKINIKGTGDVVVKGSKIGQN